MALTAAIVSRALRLGNTAEETAEATRLMAVAVALVTKHAPDAPAAVRPAAASRTAGYLYDQPNAGRGAAYADAVRFSGASALLSEWRAHGVGVIG